MGDVFKKLVYEDVMATETAWNLVPDENCPSVQVGRSWTVGQFSPAPLHSTVRETVVDGSQVVGHLGEPPPKLTVVLSS